MTREIDSNPNYSTICEIRVLFVQILCDKSLIEFQQCEKKVLNRLNTKCHLRPWTYSKRRTCRVFRRFIFLPLAYYSTKTTLYWIIWNANERFVRGMDSFARFVSSIWKQRKLKYSILSWRLFITSDNSDTFGAARFSWMQTHHLVSSANGTCGAQITKKKKSLRNIVKVQ